MAKKLKSRKSRRSPTKVTRTEGSPFYYDQVMHNPNHTARLLTQDDKVVFTGFMDQLPSVSIQNDWGDLNDSITNKLVDKATSIVQSSAGMMMTDMVQDTASFMGVENDTFNGIMNTIRGAQNAYVRGVDGIVKRFNGTKVSGIESFTIGAVLINDLESSNIEAQVNKIIQVTTGRYWTAKDWSANTGMDADNAQKTETLANNFVGIMSAPNGYQLDRNAFLGDKVLKGTFTLEVGNVFRFRNIVVSSVDINYSTTHVMKADGSKDRSRLSYVEVKMQCMPVIEPNPTTLARARNEMKGS